MNSSSSSCVGSQHFARRTLATFTLAVVSFFAVSLVSRQAPALTLYGLYTAACQRSIGVFLDADDSEVTFLTINGKVKKIRPFEIIYLVEYPMDQFPSPGPIDLSGVPKRDLKTLLNYKPVDLVSGWPIAFSPDKVSFLTPTGQETVIDKEDIFSIHKSDEKDVVRMQSNSRPDEYRFVHPYAFRQCRQENTSRAARDIYPEQMLDQPIAIKREIDRIREGYDRLNFYEAQQRFYPVPEIYSNKTSLGMWVLAGSRYGASGKRVNNLTPVLVDTYSSDVFDYQHIIKTGSAPLSVLSHEEAQTQFYYAFKASYFHFGGFFDPSTLLVGTNYPWHRSDLGGADYRLNDTYLLEFGFDFGDWAIRFIDSAYQFGAAGDNSTFFKGTSGGARFGLSYRQPKFSIDGFAGGDSVKDLTDSQSGSGAENLDILRLNASLYFIPRWKVSYSFISRQSTFQLTNSGSSATDFEDKTNSLTNAFYADYAYRKRVTLGGMLSFENVSLKYGEPVATNSHSNLYVKSGLYAALSF